VVERADEELAMRVFVIGISGAVPSSGRSAGRTGHVDEGK
jgi:hypothetical protein